MRNEDAKTGRREDGKRDTDLLIRRSDNLVANDAIAVDASTELRRLRLRGNELAACLKKYQARYARSPHAVKDHARSAFALENWEAIRP